MARTVELTDLAIVVMHINYERQVVHVEYDLKDAAGKTWDRGEAYFWVTIPDPPMGQPGQPGQQEIPENWFQLPADYIPVLLSLRDDADAALSDKFLV